MKPARIAAVRLMRAVRCFADMLAWTHPLLRQEERDVARAFSLLIALFLVAHTLISPFWLLTTRNTTVVPWMVLINTCVLVIGLVFTRTRCYRATSYVTVGLAFVNVTLLMVDDVQRGFAPFVVGKFYLLCVLVAAFMLQMRGLLMVGAICLGAIVLFNVVLARVPAPGAIGEITFSILTSTLIIIGRYTRDQVAVRLRASEQRYRALFEQSNDAILLITPEGEIVEANPRAADIVGYEPDQLRQKRYLDLVVEREHKDVLDIRARLLAGEQFGLYERTLLRRDGSEVLTEMSLALIRHSLSGTRQIQIILRDLRMRKQAERSAIRVAVEQERGRILAQFVRGASHEFRTPLSIIGTNVHLLRRPLNEADRTRRLDSVLAQSERINRLVNMMLLMVRLDTGEPFEIKRVALSEVLSELTYYFETRSAGRLTLVCEIDPDMPHLYIDRFFFTEALRHLLNNAIQYTQGEGKVWFAAECNQQSGLITISVRDQGIGMHSTLHERIFERFFRADEAYSVEGFGLGLSIVRAVIERHGGTIHVDSAPGAGSTFTLRLPASTALIRTDNPGLSQSPPNT